jgi:hypothetical protein
MSLEHFDGVAVTNGVNRWTISGSFRRSKRGDRGLLSLETVHGDINDRAGLRCAVAAFAAARFGVDATSARYSERRL